MRCTVPPSSSIGVSIEEGWGKGIKILPYVQGGSYNNEEGCTVGKCKMGDRRCVDIPY